MIAGGGGGGGGKICTVLAISLDVPNCHEFRHFAQLEFPKTSR